MSYLCYVYGVFDMVKKSKHITLSQDIHDKVQEEADRRGISFSEMVEIELRKRIDIDSIINSLSKINV